MTTISELEKRVASPAGVYLLYGENTYTLNRYLRKIRKNFGEIVPGINEVVLDEDTIQNLISDMETPAFGYEKKLIIVKQCGLVKKDGRGKKNKNSAIRDKLQDYLEQNAEAIQKSVVLVIIEDMIDACPLAKTIEQMGTVYQFQEMKTNELIQTIGHTFSLYHVKISAENAKYLLEQVGPDMQNLMNEIWKLVSYKGENGTVTKEDIQQLVVPKIEAVIFDLTDSLGKKEIARAMDVLHGLLYQKEPIQKIFITLYRHFKKLYWVKWAQARGKDPGTILNLKPNQTFLISKYKRQASYFQEEDSYQLLAQFRNLDKQSKTGEIDLQIGLEMTLCQYCS